MIVYIYWYFTNSSGELNLNSISSERRKSNFDEVDGRRARERPLPPNF